MKHIKKTGFSKLTVKFFALFAGYSLLSIISIIIITSIIIFLNAPGFKGRPFPPPDRIAGEGDSAHFEKGHPPDRDHSPDRGHHFSHRPPKKPGFPLGLIKDIAFSLLIFAALALIFSLVIANYLSKYFLFPISQLADATKKFSNHNFGYRISSKRTDEIGMLANDFNEMASKLEKYEEMRKQWIADIAHELRTPITIMQAEIEAVQDSVSPLSMTTIDRLHREAKYLAKTVNDLHRVSIAESRKVTLNLEEIALTEIILDTAARFKERLVNAGIVLDMELLNSNDSIVVGDVYLIKTVLDNLFENSARYTDSPGKLKVSSFIENEFLVVNFDDSSPEVPPEMIDKIFDRLFRADSSRSRIHGGSGMGLSISKIYVEMLGGAISSSKSPLGGLRITLKLLRQMKGGNGEAEYSDCRRRKPDSSHS
ncbi:MAG: ATP-binding protein [bacterium]